MTRAPKTWLNQVGFVIKVLVGSAAISVALKTLGPYLPLTANASTSLVIVLVPSLLLGSLLGWQLWSSRHVNATNPKSD